MGYNSPNDKLVLFSYFYGVERVIFGLEPDGNYTASLSLKMDSLKGELPVYIAYGHSPLVRLKGFVYYEQVTIIYAGPLHRGSPGPSKESAGGVLYQFPVEVYPVLHIILGRAWEPRLNLGQFNTYSRLTFPSTHL